MWPESGQMSTSGFTGISAFTHSKKINHLVLFLNVFLRLLFLLWSSWQDHMLKYPNIFFRVLQRCFKMQQQSTGRLLQLYFLLQHEDFYSFFKTIFFSLFAAFSFLHLHFSYAAPAVMISNSRYDWTTTEEPSVCWVLVTEIPPLCAD